MVIGFSKPEYHALISGTSAEFGSARAKFDALREAWDDFNAHRSVIDFDHPAYHQIMAMGGDAVPFLLECLEQGDTDWFYALKCITGVDVAPQGTRRSPRDLIDAWLAWGDAHGVRVGKQ